MAGRDVLDRFRNGCARAPPVRETQ